MKKTILIISLIIGYIFIVNVIAELPLNLAIQDNYNSQIDDGNVKIGVSDSVSVSVYRQRIYGNIYETNGNSKLYLFGFAPIPLKSKGIGYIKFHIVFLALLALFSYKIYKKKEIIKEEYVYIE